MELIFDGKAVEYDSSVSVLDCLLNSGYDIPHSCKSGSCHSCLLQVVDGEACSNSQQGLKNNLTEQGWFKSCVCFPSHPLKISTNGKTEKIPVRLILKKLLHDRILLLRLKPKVAFEYRSGQYINLIRPEDGLSRSYSLASIAKDEFLELHIRCFDDGRMSNWLKNTVNEGDELEINGPHGDCYYASGNESQDMLFAGIGTGMAPLYGIVRDALKKGHSGKITLIQGAMDQNGLYYVEQFSAVADEFDNFNYVPSTVDGSGGIVSGTIDEVVKDFFPSLKDFRVFLCGSPNTVKRLKKYAFLSGASMKEILSDSFTPAAE